MKRPTDEQIAAAVAQLLVYILAVLIAVLFFSALFPVEC